MHLVLVELMAARSVVLPRAGGFRAWISNALYSGKKLLGRGVIASSASADGWHEVDVMQSCLLKQGVQFQRYLDTVTPRI